MNINYSQSTGIITKDDGTVLVPAGHAWAGHGEGKNNPAMEQVHCIGPLPRGTYTLGAWGKHDELGPDSCHLTQTEGESYGRDGFYIHGPSQDPIKHGQESKGCIVVEHDYRIGIIALNPNIIIVLL